MKWRRRGPYVHERIGEDGRPDGVKVCRYQKLIHCDSDEPDRDEDEDVMRWRYRASGPDGWLGPWRIEARQAFEDAGDR